MPPTEPNDEERLEQFPEDGQTPFSAPDPARDSAQEPDSSAQPAAQPDDTHPSTDAQLDSTQFYNEGADGAAEASEPNAGNDVTGFSDPEASADPEEDAL